MRRWVAALVAGILPWSAPVTAQSPVALSPSATIGLLGGYASTQHVWDPSSSSESVGGMVVGGFLDTRTPQDWLTVRLEISYAQRGSDVTLEAGGSTTQGGVRTDYLLLAPRIRALVGVGRARLQLAAGPTFDFVLRSRLDSQLTQVLEEPTTVPVGLLLGAGLGLWVSRGWYVEVEARLYEGLQSVYSGDLISARSRGQELVLRVGTPFSFSR